MLVPVVWITRMNLWGRESLLAHHSNLLVFDTFVSHNSNFWHEIGKQDFNSDGGSPCIDVLKFRYPRLSLHRRARTRSSRFRWKRFNSRRHWTDHQRGRWYQNYPPLPRRTRSRERSQCPTLKSKLYGGIDSAKSIHIFCFLATLFALQLSTVSLDSNWMIDSWKAGPFSFVFSFSHNGITPMKHGILIRTFIPKIKKFPLFRITREFTIHERLCSMGQFVLR